MTFSRNEFIDKLEVSVGVHVRRLGKGYRDVDVRRLLGTVYDTMTMCGVEFSQRAPAPVPTTSGTDRP